MPGTSRSAPPSSSVPQTRCFPPSFSLLFPAFLFACGIGGSRGYPISIPVSLPESIRSFSPGSWVISGIRTATTAATSPTPITTPPAANPTAITTATTTTASAATTASWTALSSAATSAGSWTASSSATTRALETPRVPQRTPPYPHLTGHRLRRERGGSVRRLFSSEMSGVSGDAVGASAPAAAAAAASGGGGSEVKPGGGDGGKNVELRGSLPAVTLDPDAIQKFAEIELQWGGDDEGTKPTVFIRGKESAVFHKDAARPTMELLREAGERPTMTGGGRIKHSTEKQTIFVYGYSIEFGRADLPRVAELCQTAYPDYEVTWKSDGY